MQYAYCMHAVLHERLATTSSLMRVTSTRMRERMQQRVIEQNACPI